jgi:cation diffusion facilitator CzcD-associated flavoprotein CzcO
VCEKHSIADKFRLNTEVRELRWLEEIEEWEVTLTYLIPGTGDLTVRERQEKAHAEGDGAVYQASEKIRAKIVISGAGKLVQPNLWPKDIPSIDKFEGDLIHTARWNNKVDLNGKDVVVVGSGCSAAQVVPQLVKPPFNARSVTQVMRSPPWVEPNALSPDNLDRWEKYMPWLLRNIPLLARALRVIFFCIAEVSFILIFSQLPFGEFRQANYKKRLLKHMRNSVPDKYHKMLTPNYNVGCKRRVYDVEWFRSLQHPNVELTTLPLRSVEQKAVTLGPTPSTLDGKMTRDDVKVRADTIILANGYRVTSWLHPLSVKGRGGKDLGELWSERGGVQAYLGVAVDKFPNFFLIFGPNTSNGHTSVLLAIENAVNYSLRFIKPILDGEVISYEVREEAVTAWTNKIQKALKNSVWMTGGCHSWYKTEDGWNATIYPYVFPFPSLVKASDLN